jgi:hypothetical protein
MKKTLPIIFLVIIFISLILLGVSCDVEKYTDKEELPRVEGYKKVIVIDDCEYIEYQSTFYCGHQYNHHEYKASFLTHKGNCINHELRSEYESNLNKREYGKYQP